MASNNRLGESMVNRLFPWWIGVVEDRMDSMGRVRVRVYGFHTSDVKKLKTKDLPWFMVQLPTTSACSSGLGSNHGLVEGYWVTGHWIDGGVANVGIVTGTFWGNTPDDRIKSGLGKDILLDGGIKSTYEINPNTGFQAPPDLERHKFPKDILQIKIPSGEITEGNDSGVQFMDKNKKNYPEDEYKNKSELNSLHTNDCDKQKKLDGKTPSLKKLKETTRTNGGLLDDEFQLFPPFQKEFFSGIIKGLGGTIKNKYDGDKITSTTFKTLIQDYKPFSEIPQATNDGGYIIYDKINVQQVQLG